MMQTLVCFQLFGNFPWLRHMLKRSKRLFIINGRARRSISVDSPSHPGADFFFKDLAVIRTLPWMIVRADVDSASASNRAFSTDRSVLRWESSETPSVGKKCSAKRVNIAAESVVKGPSTLISICG